MNVLIRSGLLALACGALLTGCQTQSTAPQQEPESTATAQSPAGTHGSSQAHSRQDNGNSPGAPANDTASAQPVTTDSTRPDAPAPTRGGPVSDEEARDALDERLAGSVGDFDRMILTERRRIGGAALPDDGMGAAGNGTGNGAGNDTGIHGSAGNGHDAGDTGNGSATGQQQARGGATDDARHAATQLPGNAPGSHENIPDDIPSGENDDIVARQIREAAINEPDPQLREKLWDEYRRYRGLK